MLPGEGVTVRRDGGRQAGAVAGVLIESLPEYQGLLPVTTQMLQAQTGYAVGKVAVPGVGIVFTATLALGEAELQACVRAQWAFDAGCRRCVPSRHSG